MNRFPSEIIKSMRSNRAMTTCVPVEFDEAGWETAVFFELGGKQCEQDREILKTTKTTLPVALEADVIECPSAAVVMLRFEILTQESNPFAGEVLLTPGIGSVQFEALQRLAKQDILRFFFSDAGYNIIHSQQLSLNDQERQGYQGILDDAVKYDAMVRLTGRYDAKAALKEVTGHYATHVEKAQ